jgi:hypothetical protein
MRIEAGRPEIGLAFVCISANLIDFSSKNSSVRHMVQSFGPYRIRYNKYNNLVVRGR